MAVDLKATNPTGSTVNSITFSSTGADPKPATTVLAEQDARARDQEGHTDLVFAARGNNASGELPKKLHVQIDKQRPGISHAVSDLFNGSQRVSLRAFDRGPWA